MSPREDDSATTRKPAELPHPPGRIARHGMTLGRLILWLSLTYIALTLITILLISYFAERQAIDDLAHNEAQHASELVFQSLYTVMQSGATKKGIEDAIRRLSETQHPLKISTVRGETVARQYGELLISKKRRQQEPEIAQVFATGEEWRTYTEDRIRFLYPVHFASPCRQCHTQARETEVAGVIDITYPIDNLKISLRLVSRAMIAYFLFAIVLLFVLLAWKLRTAVAQPIGRFVNIMREITQHPEGNRRAPVDGGIVELQNLSNYFNDMLQTIQDYQRKLDEYSNIDPLTGLFNRRRFQQILSYEIGRAEQHGRSLPLIGIDLDNFKNSNDTHGYPVGDLVLKKFSYLLRNLTRHHGIAARRGADEFAVLLPEASPEEAVTLANAIRKKLNESDFRLPEGNLRVPASLCLLSYPRHGTQANDLEAALELGLYKAKRLGKNRIVTLDESDRDLYQESLARGEFLRKAIAEDRVEPFFQPILNLRDNTVYGHEVLARIRDGDAWITAAHFIHEVEALGIDPSFDSLIFHKALSYRRQHGLEGRLFINLSPRSFSSRETLCQLAESIREYGVDARDIVFEITEREALPRLSELNQVIAELKQKGFGFALDDFGSGFSSFIYLKYLDVDVIKIEGSFVRKMASDDRDKIMVEHIASMASRFNILTLAEMVEDPRTDALLRRMGVKLGQGFHYGRPHSIDGRHQDREGERQEF